MKEKKEYTFIKGFRAGNRSVKIYKSVDDKYLIIKSKYFFGIRIRNEKVIVNDLELAEDFIRELKFDEYCGRQNKYNK